MPLLELSKLFGLPAHPLLVHAAVVLVPLAAVALIAVGWRDSWRRTHYLPIALLAIAGAGATFLAKQSGEPLAESVRHAGKKVGEHPEQGDIAFIFAMLFAGACLVLYAWSAFGESALPLAALAIWAMIVAGHSGATLVWKTNK